MYTNNTIYPLPDGPDSPFEGEDVLSSMLQWGAEDRGRQGVLAALIQLNWTVGNGPGRVYDQVVRDPQEPLFTLAVEQVTQMLDALAEEGMSPEVICFTGEDPAGHPRLLDFLELARQRSISQIGLQCNGLRLAHDDQLLETLSRLRPLLFVELDSFDETASLILHGRRDLPFEAKRGLDRLAASGLTAALLTSVAQGVNLQEVGAIAAYGLKHPAVTGAIFRPLPPRDGRLGLSPSTHVSAAKIMEVLEQQSNSLFRRDAFVPALCCRPIRHFYAQVPYIGPNDPDTNHGPGHWATQNGYRTPPNAGSCFWLGVHDFMTPWSKDPQQARRCPLVIMTSDGRTIPYCLYNSGEAK